MADITTDRTPPTAEAGTTSGATGAETQTAQPVDTGRTFTQSDLDRIVSARLAEEKQRNEQAQAKARQKADEENKVKQGEFQSLAEQRQARIAELEPALETTKTQYQALVDVMEEQIKERAKALPDSLRALRPEGDVLQQMKWLAKAEIAAQQLQVQRTPGTPAGPAGTGGNTMTTTTPQTVIDAKRRDANYGI